MADDPQEQAAIASQPSGRERRVAGLIAVAILLATCAAYAPATRCGFIWDDDHYVTENPVVREPGGLARAWFEIGATPQYYPLVFTTFWIEHALWGLRPAGYHVVNILLHAANAILLWRILAGLRVPGAPFAAFLFALHPVHVESVAWITERKNVLSGLFYLAALSVYLRFSGLADPPVPAPSAPPSPQSRVPSCLRAYVLSLALFVCALLSKTVTCSLPAAVLLLVWWKRGRIDRRDVLPLVPFFLVGLAFAGLTAWMECTNVGAEGADWDLTLIDRTLIAGRALWFYLGKLIWPHPLVFIYPRWTIDAAVLWQYAYPLAFVALLAVFWQTRRHVGRGPLVTALLFAGTLFPALGFLNVYPMRFSFVADHFQYLASIAPLALLAALVARLAGSNAPPEERIPASPVNASHPPRRFFVTGAQSAVLLLLAVLTWRQCRIYENEEVLWTDTLQKNDGAWMAHGNLCKFLVSVRRFDEAIEHARVALGSRPDLPSAYCNLAGALIAADRQEEAIPLLEHALKMKPDQIHALHDLGYAHLKSGRPQQALAALEQANRLAPRVFRIHQLLGETRSRLGDETRALTHYQEALRLSPNSAATHQALALIFAHRGENAAAIEHFKQALRLRPNLAEAWANLAAVLGAEGLVDQAITCLQRAIAIRPDYPNARFNLGCLLADAGRNAEAIAQFEEVLRLRPDDAEAGERLRRLKSPGTQPRSDE